MRDTFGMPGPGGSLGQCALCGASFITEILLGQHVHSFSLREGGQTLYGHDKCMKEFDGKQVTDLPKDSPIRQAYERQPEEATP